MSLSGFRSSSSGPIAARATAVMAAAASVAVGALGGGTQSFFEPVWRQPLAGLDVSGIPFLDRGAAVQAQQSLDLADDLAAGGVGLRKGRKEEGVKEGGRGQAIDGCIVFFTFRLRYERSKPCRANCESNIPVPSTM